jgi:hypothetical protein
VALASLPRPEGHAAQMPLQRHWRELLHVLLLLLLLLLLLSVLK